MKNLLILLVLSTGAFANLSEYVPSGVTVSKLFTKAEIGKMLAEGKTCVKDGVKVIYQSKDLTKKHCQKAKYLKGIRVIKANQTDFYAEILGLN